MGERITPKPVAPRPGLDLRGNTTKEIEEIRAIERKLERSATGEPILRFLRERNTHIATLSQSTLTQAYGGVPAAGAYVHEGNTIYISRDVTANTMAGVETLAHEGAHAIDFSSDRYRALLARAGRATTAAAKASAYDAYRAFRLDSEIHGDMAAQRVLRDVTTVKGRATIEKPTEAKVRKRLLSLPPYRWLDPAIKTSASQFDPTPPPRPAPRR